MRATEADFGWTRPFDLLVRTATTRFPLLASVTPRNAAEEQARLTAAWSSGVEASPRWEPPARDGAALNMLRRAVDDAIARLHLRSSDPWRALYRGRLMEIATDLAVSAAAFDVGLSGAADARFGRDAQVDIAAGSALAKDWSAGRAAPSAHDRRALIETDDVYDPHSLVSRMREEIASRRLGVRVILRERVGALAAAGDGIVVVATGKRISEEETERVVLHEIAGHVLPRERGRGEQPALASLGSAFASEDEEGRALLLEDRAGLLGPRRRRTLAARHRAAELVLSGASYVEVVRALRSEDVSLDDALAIASRVMRGGHVRGRDTVAGLARERVYLPALSRVGCAVAAEPSLLDRLGQRRLSLAACALLV